MWPAADESCLYPRSPVAFWIPQLHPDVLRIRPHFQSWLLFTARYRLNEMPTSEEAKGPELSQVEDAFTDKMTAAPPAEPDAAMLVAEKRIV